MHQELSPVRSSYMKSLIFTVVAILVTPLAVTGEAEKKSAIDPKAAEILRRTASFYTQAKSMSVELTMSLEVSSEDKTETYSAVYDVAIEKPNKVAIRLKKGIGFTIISDGKHVYTYSTTSNQYTRTDAPATLDAFFGSKFGRDDAPEKNEVVKAGGGVYEILIEGVNKAEYAGVDVKGPIKAHKIRAQTTEHAWNLLIKDGDQPHVLEASPSHASLIAILAHQVTGKDFNVNLKLTNWLIGDQVHEDTFKFKSPAGAKQVHNLLN